MNKEQIIWGTWAQAVVVLSILGGLLQHFVINPLGL